MDIQRDLGIGVFAFGAWIPKYFTVSYPGVEVTIQERGLERIVTYETPYGTLRTRHVLAEELIDADVTGMQVEHAYKNEKDFDALLYLIENSVSAQTMAITSACRLRLARMAFLSHLPAMCRCTRWRTCTWDMRPSTIRYSIIPTR